MKQIYTALFIFFIGQCSFAQTNETSFNENVLSQFGSYFENAELGENGTIHLQAKEVYSSLTQEKKNTIIELVLSKLENQTFAIVSCGYKRELWKKNVPFNEVKLLDDWDLNNLYSQKSSLKTLQKTDVHPWFFYFGTNDSFSKDMANISLASRIGFFLLKDRWDFALSCSAGISGYETTTASVDVGLMTKVYFPIKKYNISPYAGTGISHITSATSVSGGDDMESNSWNIPLYLGISWFTGPGSLDLGFQISDNTIFTIGYTFSPSALFKK
jgi:hypothetical protein